MTCSIARPPVTVFCGFLGAGKTMLLNHLLAQARGRQWAVVVNDVASLNIDAALVREATEAGRKVVDLGNGCVCCSNRDELGETIAELSATADYAHILVETTGVAEPRGVAALFTQKNPFGRSLSEFARLSALVTIVDAAHFFREWRAHQDRGVREFPAGAQRPVFELMIEQVECADVLVVNKCDLVTADELTELEAMLHGLNGRAEVIRSERGQVDEERLLGRVRFDAAETLRAAAWLKTLNALVPASGAAPLNVVARGAASAKTTAPAHERNFGIQTVVYQARRPFQEAKLREFLAREAAGLLRAKGFFWAHERPDEMGFLSVAGGMARVDYLNYWWAALVENGKARADDRPETIRAIWEEPSGDRRQELVFIGVGLDGVRITAALDACLV